LKVQTQADLKALLADQSLDEPLATRLWSILFPNSVYVEINISFAQPLVYYETFLARPYIIYSCRNPHTYFVIAIQLQKYGDRG